MKRARGCMLLTSLAIAACQASARSAPAASTAQWTALPAATATSHPSPAPPTVTASPTATLPPPAREFTQAFDEGLPYWSFLQAGAAEAQPAPVVSGGALKFALTAPYAWGYALYEGYTYTDVRVDALIKFDTAGPSSAGVICRYDPALGWYEFNIHPDQTYALLFGQWLAEGIARYSPLVVSSSEEITPTENEIGLVCAADTLTPYINGVQIRAREEKLHVLSEGRVGASATSYERAPLTVSYDWISVGNP